MCYNEDKPKPRGVTEYLNLPRDMGHHVTELLGLSVHSGFSFINNALSLQQRHLELIHSDPHAERPI